MEWKYFYLGSLLHITLYISVGRTQDYWLVVCNFVWRISWSADKLLGVAIALLDQQLPSRKNTNNSPKATEQLKNDNGNKSIIIMVISTDFLCY